MLYNIAIMNVTVKGVSEFRLPRYSEIPDVGLYLEQTTKYINSYLEPIGFEITSAMIKNYVKKGLLKNPEQKQYYADHIAHLIAVSVLKNVIPLENISMLFQYQQKVYTDDMAYDYFCKKLESMLFYQFGIIDSVDKIGTTDSLEKNMLRSAIVAVSHIIYLKSCFSQMSDVEN